jgi:diguanylate cyclase (GGDEF)-like protein
MNRHGRQSLALLRFLIGVVLFSGAILAILDNIGRQDLSAVCATVFVLPVVVHMGPRVYLGLIIPYAILLSVGILIWGGMNIQYLGILIQIWGYTAISIVIQKSLFSNRLDRYLCQLEILDANARISKLASRDSVTGLYNHKHFESLLNAEWQRSRRHSHVFSMIQLELDFPVGDEVLRHVGAYLQTLLRRSDHAARLSDSRFLLLLVETEMEGACILAERLRVGLAQLPSARELGHAITASIGVATSSEAAGIDALQQIVSKRMKSARVSGPGHIISK